MRKKKKGRRGKKEAAPAARRRPPRDGYNTQGPKYGRGATASGVGREAAEAFQSRAAASVRARLPSDVGDGDRKR